MQNIHEILKAHLQKHFNNGNMFPEQWQYFIRDVDHVLKQYEHDLAMLECSLELSSQELLQAYSEMKAVFQAFPDLFFRLDTDGVILDYKVGIEADLCHPTRDILGTQFQAILTHDYRKIFIQRLRYVLQNKTTTSMEYTLGLQGKIVFYEARFVPFLDNQIIVIVRNISDRKAAEDELRRSEDRYRMLIELSPNAIFVHSDGVFVFINNAGVKLLGASSADEIINRPIIDFIHPDYRAMVQERNRKIYQYNHSFDAVEEKYLRVNGSEVEVEVTAIPFQSKGKPAIQLVIRDISEQKQIEKRLRQAKEEAEAASRSKSAFLANMSHEIRTPLNGIIGLNELMFDTSVSQEQHQYLSMMKSSANQLLRLLNDILDFSKIEAGQLQLEDIDFDLQITVENVCDIAIPQIEEKGLELYFFIHREVPLDLKGDPGRLSQILVNLVGNAIKFTNQGEIIIKVELEEVAENIAHIHFSVSDTGIGIDKKRQKNIFESFTQADSSTTRKFGGTGLGLTISRQLVEMMDGKIWAESPVQDSDLIGHPQSPGIQKMIIGGPGSTFHFTGKFPMQKKVRAKEEPVPVFLRSLKVLAVNVNTRLLFILSEMLKSFGCSIEVINSEWTAIKILEQDQKYDVLIMDYQYSTMKPGKFIAGIRRDPGLKYFPIIFLTSTLKNRNITRLEKLINIWTLSKPFKKVQLYNTLIAAAGKPEQQLLRSQNVLKSSANDIVRQLNLISNTTKILMVEDNLINQKVAFALLKKTEIPVDIANDGALALEMLKTTHYDLILMDVQMPNMDGPTATQKIRQELGRTDIPIIALTAHAMKGDREKCLAVGMNDYISKPIEPTELYRILAKWLIRKRNKDLVFPEDSNEKES